ncbi:MAG TPA: hypothetical protein DDX75_07680, partial [Phycisphaerales bacterium]|nr:hypothetical protein [Phycisphaerales bacterium]
CERFLTVPEIPSRGVELIEENSQAFAGKELMKNATSVLSDCLATKNQNDLKKIIKAWPRLSEHIQRTILALVEMD